MEDSRPCVDASIRGKRRTFYDLIFLFVNFRQFSKASDWFGNFLSGRPYNAIVTVRHIIYNAHSIGECLFTICDRARENVP